MANERAGWLYTITEAAAATGRDASQVRRWIAKGLIPSVRREGDIRKRRFVGIAGIEKIMEMPHLGYTKVRTTRALRLSDGSVRVVAVIEDVRD
jgi:hypothetical protein